MALNGISTLATKELRQKAKLDLAAANRAADGNSRFTYDITQLPTVYNDNSVVDNPNTSGLVIGRPWLHPGAAYFTGSNYLLNASNISVAGDFTIECYFKPTATTQSSFLQIGNEATGRIVFFTFNGGLCYNIYGAATVTLATGIALDVWQHVAIVRSGTTITGYINGTVGTTPATGVSGTVGNAAEFTIGSASSAPMYISNFRAVNGTAVYTGNFAPPLSILQPTQDAGTNIAAITNTTQVLLPFTQGVNFLKDYSANNYTMTNTGSVTSVAY